MLLNRKTNRRIRGFTIVELMVSAALAITIMWILSESFKIGIDFARTARSTGDMMTQLNNAGQILTRDLEANHFYVSQSGLSGNLGKLSSQRLDNMGGTSNGTDTTTFGVLNPRMATAGGYLPPAGYFQIFSPPPSVFPAPQDITEGFQIDTVNAAGSTSNPLIPWNGAIPTATPFLRFTVFLPQGLPQNVFSATTTAPPPTNVINYFSQAAEVAFFLGSPGPNTATTGLGTPTGHTPAVPGTADQPAVPAQPLYNLYRRQCLVAQTSDFANNLNPLSSNDPFIQEILSITPLQQLAPPNTKTPQINTLNAFGQAYTGQFLPVPIPANRVLMQPLQSPNRIGDDILLSNVLSFEVLASWTAPNPNNPGLILTGPPQFPNLVGNGQPIYRPFTANNTSPLNSNHPFDFLPTFSLNPRIPAGTFDTWFMMNQPYPIGNPIPKFVNWNWDNFYLLNNPGPLQISATGKITNVPNPNLIPMPIRITALQITIRIYDSKTQQARQNTWRIAM